MSRGSSRKADKLREKRNHPPPDQPWVWLTRELLESDAWHTAPINTRRLVERIMLEHIAHAGTMNGELAVTYEDFEKWGIRDPSVGPAIQDAMRRGLIDRTQEGRASHGLDRWPSKYALGWLPSSDGAAALNRWKHYKMQKHSKDNFLPTYGSVGGERRKRGIAHLRKRRPLPPTEAKAALPGKYGKSPPTEAKVLSISWVREPDHIDTEQEHTDTEEFDGWRDMPDELRRWKPKGGDLP